MFQTLFGCIKKKPAISTVNSLTKTKRVRTQSAFELNLVLVARLELARYCYRGILSPLCLPIPPQRHEKRFAKTDLYNIISADKKQAFYFVIFIFLSDKSTWDMVHSYVLSHVRFHASIVDARNTNIVFAVIFLCFVNPVNFTFMLLPQHGERIKINPNFVAALFLRFIKNKLHTQM